MYLPNYYNLKTYLSTNTVADITETIMTMVMDTNTINTVLSGEEFKTFDKFN